MAITGRGVFPYRSVWLEGRGAKNAELDLHRDVLPWSSSDHATIWTDWFFEAAASPPAVMPSLVMPPMVAAGGGRS